jgi:hypothetical protein
LQHILSLHSRTSKNPRKLERGEIGEKIREKKGEEEGEHQQQHMDILHPSTLPPSW